MTPEDLREACESDDTDVNYDALLEHVAGIVDNAYDLGDAIVALERLSKVNGTAEDVVPFRRVPDLRGGIDAADERDRRYWQDRAQTAEAKLDGLGKQLGEQANLTRLATEEAVQWKERTEKAEHDLGLLLPESLKRGMIQAAEGEVRERPDLVLEEADPSAQADLLDQRDRDMLTRAEAAEQRVSELEEELEAEQGERDHWRKCARRNWTRWQRELASRKEVEGLWAGASREDAEDYHELAEICDQIRDRAEDAEALVLTLTDRAERWEARAKHEAAEQGCSNHHLNVRLQEWAEEDAS